MDNLAHSAFGAVLGAALEPELIVDKKNRALLCSALLANLPDIDILIRFFDAQAYVLHHRGLTHSILGLALTLPLGLAIFRLILGPLPFYRSFRFVFLQIALSHFFLDYLTSYGTMFLYPFSFQRFSYPLMFIIDPFFWLITWGGLWFVVRSSPKTIRKKALITLGSSLILWFGELYGKKSVEALSQKEVYASYPGPLAPLNWHTVGPEGETSFSFFRDPKFQEHPLPSSLEKDHLCRDQPYVQEAQESFARFSEWAEYPVCEPYTFDRIRGCRCYSLKYAIAQLGLVTFGEYFIPPEGPGFFFQPDLGKMLRLRHFWFESLTTPAKENPL